MPEFDMGEISSMIMVMFGNIFTLIALGGSLLLLIGLVFNSDDLSMRGGGVGFLALVLTTVGLVQKTANPETAGFESGFIFGFSDGLVMVLLGVSAVLWLSGFALFMRRRLA
jgi:hypothetical protein